MSYKSLSNFYTQLGQHLESGLPLEDALNSLSHNHKLAREIQRADINQGTSVWLNISSIPLVDRGILKSAAESGKLPSTLNQLSEFYHNSAVTRQKLILQTIYPTLVIHIALFGLPLIKIPTEGISGYFSAISSFLPYYLICVIFILFVSFHERSRLLLFSYLPFFKGYIKNSKYSQFTASLGIQLESGVIITKALKDSFHLIPSSRLRNCEPQIQRELNRGNSPFHIFKRMGFHPTFLQYYISGEKSGHLPENLLKASKLFQLEASNAITKASIIYPILFLILVGAYVCIRLIDVVNTYFDKINGL